ncbi:MAG: CHAD domain-containing protein [Gammaproteobacteria bacterium]
MMAPLDPQMRADLAVAQVLGAHYTIMNRHERGLLKGADPDALHDFRVAIRASRSILNQTRGVFPERPYQRFRGVLAWLADCTGAARDLDVFLEKMPEFRHTLSAALNEGLAPLEAVLREAQKVEQKRLAKTCAARRYVGFKRAYGAFLGDHAAHACRTPHGNEPIVALASRVIRKRYRKALAGGRHVGEDAPSATLHELRKNGKKLRYLIESFRGLYRDEEEVRAILKQLKEIQDVLGKLVDLNVQRRLLREWPLRADTASSFPPGALTAAQTLDVRLSQEELKTRGSFAERYASFASRETRGRFERLFGEG